MTSRRLLTRPWWVGLFLVVCLSLPALAQQAPTSDMEVARHGALALAAAHGEQPRYGGKFLSAGNEEIPFYDLGVPSQLRHEAKTDSSRHICRSIRGPGLPARSGRFIGEQMKY